MCSSFAILELICHSLIDISKVERRNGRRTIDGKNGAEETCRLENRPANLYSHPTVILDNTYHCIGYPLVKSQQPLLRSPSMFNISNQVPQLQFRAGDPIITHPRYKVI